MRRKIADGRGTARETVKGGDQIGGEPRGVEAEVLDDAQDVRILLLQKLVQPMDGFDVGVAPHLAEDGGGFDGFVADGIQLAE